MAPFSPKSPLATYTIVANAPASGYRQEGAMADRGFFASVEASRIAMIMALMAGPQRTLLLLVEIGEFQQLITARRGVLSFWTLSLRWGF